MSGTFHKGDLWVALQQQTTQDQTQVLAFVVWDESLRFQHVKSLISIPKPKLLILSNKKIKKIIFLRGKKKKKEH